MGGHRNIGKQYFSKPSHLEIHFDSNSSFSKKSCRNFYWRKKKWEKRNFRTNQTVDVEFQLHRSPKCSRTSDSCSPCNFASATTRVCQNITYSTVSVKKSQNHSISKNRFFKNFAWICPHQADFAVIYTFCIGPHKAPLDSASCHGIVM